MVKYAVASLAGVLCAVGAMVAHTWEAEGAQFPRRAYVAGIARDQEVATQPSKPVPPVPPNAVFGLLTIAGTPAPAGTLVTLTFNGLPGPSAYTAAAGGYCVDYAAGERSHAPLHQRGRHGDRAARERHARTSGVPVGPEAGLAFRFDVAIP